MPDHNGEARHESVSDDDLFRLEVGDEHRVVVEFGDGVYMTKLIHPEGGCGTPDQCGQCGRSFIDPDPDTKPCYDCPDDPKAASKECWVQGWFDDLTADELLHGSVELVVRPKWEFDHCELHIVGSRPAVVVERIADALSQDAEVRRRETFQGQMGQPTVMERGEADNV